MSAPPISPIPTYDRFIEPLLRLLASRPEGVPAREAHEAAADALGLDAAARQQLLSSGAQLVYKNRAGWAHDRLKRAWLSDSPRRGWWQLTEAGRRFVAEHAGPLSAEQVATLAMSHIDTRLLRPVAADAGDDQTVVQPVASPEKRPCQEVSIRHWQMNHLQINGTVERFKGHISEYIAQLWFSAADQIETTQIHYAVTYNYAIHQRVFKYFPINQERKKYRM